MLDESGRALQRLQEAARDTREYMGTPAVKQFIELLTALERTYLFDLANVKPENLLRMQGGVAQVRSLRAILESETVTSNGRI